MELFPPAQGPWSTRSWRSLPVMQQPSYPSAEELRRVESNLSNYPPLVFIEETRLLKLRLAEVARGNAFLLQGGDCAESFAAFNASTICDTLRVLLQMSLVLAFGTQRKIVKVGRIAGQFAKPRSTDMETKNGITLPAYRGDLINGHSFEENSRRPDPSRMERAYMQSASTMNVLRTFLDSENANANRIHMRTEALIAEVGAFREFAGFSELIRNAINFMNSVLPQENSSMSEFFTSHEALLLNYEEAFARQRPRNRSIPSSGAGEWYVGSGHMLWIGDRTRQPDGAHIEFLRGVANPIGIKCGPTLKPDELIRLLEVLNPQNEAGKITLISRMGHQKIQESLPPLIQRVRNEGRAVVWSCDPMHGNTYTSPNGLKTRQFTHILDELKGFFIIHDAEGSLGGGVHLELSGKSVTECIGGNEDVKYENLIEGNYTSLCDPRLNDRQAVELAFRLALFFSENPVKAR